ncbi:MAG: hypothetical protein AAF527_02955 [Pseudomonadota bacterium]
MFDTLKAFNALQSAGVSSDVAKAHVDVLTDALNEDVIATKADLKSLEQSLTIRMGGIVAAAVGILMAFERLTS